MTPTTLAAVQAAQAAHVAAAQQQHFGNFQAPQQQPSHPNPQSSGQELGHVGRPLLSKSDRQHSPLLFKHRGGIQSLSPPAPIPKY